MELSCRFQLRRAIVTARDVLLQFVTGIVGQLVIDVQQNIFLYPFALHGCTPRQGRLVLFIACPPKSHAASEWPGIRYFSPFLRWYSKSRPPSAISIPDNASTQTPSVHG